MDVIRSCAEYLNRGLVDLATRNPPRNAKAAYEAGVNITDAKVWIFNACTVALVASVVFGLCGVTSIGGALTLGACSYFGREVADESFNAVISNAGISGFVKRLAPNVLKPEPWLKFGEIVIFYNVMPRK